MYYLDISQNPYNNLPLRVVYNWKERYFVVEDLIRLIGLDGMPKQLLLTILKARFQFPSRFNTRELKLSPLDGYEERIHKHVLVDGAGAYYILSGARLDESLAEGYNDYTSKLSNWFVKQFPLNDYELYNYQQLCDSVVVPVDDRIGTDYINFIPRKGQF